MTAGAVFHDRGDSQQALAFYCRAYRLWEEIGYLLGVGGRATGNPASAGRPELRPQEPS